ncbi:hypothetical protein [Psychrobacillus lasiicapitis]|uniref:hypothetical protein n=1 Tax=Psychrobacillus lasiicapitis TaxID=1636719 RepID=UPI001B85CCD7|nr:hypothetical protein [Psychrobacillus lasiicapitis]
MSNFRAGLSKLETIVQISEAIVQLSIEIVHLFGGIVQITIKWRRMLIAHSGECVCSAVIHQDALSPLLYFKAAC